MATAAKSTNLKRAAAKNGKPTKPVEFRGLALTVPAKCPGAVLFDIGDDNVSGTLRTLLGDRQYTQVRDKVAEDELEMDVTVRELTAFLNRIFSETYGLTAGE